MKIGEKAIYRESGMAILVKLSNLKINIESRKDNSIYGNVDTMGDVIWSSIQEDLPNEKIGLGGSNLDDIIIKTNYWSSGMQLTWFFVFDPKTIEWISALTSNLVSGCGWGPMADKFDKSSYFQKFLGRE
jgi:hypothetical protein